MPDTLARVAAFLGQSGAAYEVGVLGESTRSSEPAARALRCTTAEIAKSVVFVGPQTAVVVLAGDKRVNTCKLSSLLGGPVRPGSPMEVAAATGYPVGGVPPFPHRQGIRVLADESLLAHEHVWAAAGTPNAVFRMSSRELVRLMGGRAGELSL